MNFMVGMLQASARYVCAVVDSRSARAEARVADGASCVSRLVHDFLNPLSNRFLDGFLEALSNFFLIEIFSDRLRHHVPLRPAGQWGFVGST